MNIGDFGDFRLFEEKIAFVKSFFKELYEKDFETFSSSRLHFRTRAEFGFFHTEEKIYYAMFDKTNKKKIIIENADFADEKICILMPKLLKQINQNINLKQKLFGVEFLASKEQLSTTLLYHKNIDLIKQELRDLSHELNLKLIARSKGKKLVFGGENLKQVLNINKEQFFYEFNNDCFIQPNTLINEKIIEWIVKIINPHQKEDLLELYCGYGNFTLPLSRHFRKVLATELSKKNIEFALKNCELNKSTNINFIRLSSWEITQALKKEREFFRLRNICLEDFNFSHILVDPPRCGLEKEVLTLAKNYHFIIYVSCNPLSLKENLQELCKTHTITNFALFDQFVNTPHLECALVLERK